MTDDDIDETDPDYAATARRVSEIPAADRPAALAAVLARADAALRARAGHGAAPPVPPVIGGKLVKDMTPNERAAAAAALGINLHLVRRSTGWR